MKILNKVSSVFIILMLSYISGCITFYICTKNVNDVKLNKNYKEYIEQSKKITESIEEIKKLFSIESYLISDIYQIYDEFQDNIKNKKIENIDKNISDLNKLKNKLNNYSYEKDISNIIELMNNIKKAMIENDKDSIIFNSSQLADLIENIKNKYKISIMEDVE